jgi:hypothetical protein
MTPGEVIAAAAVTICIAILALAVVRGRHSVADAALAVILGLIVTRLLKVTVPVDAQLVSAGAVWVALGSFMVRGAAKETCAPAAFAGGLFIASGLCYAAADLIGARMAFGVPPMVAADVFGFAGVAALLWGASGGRRVRNLGYRDRMARIVLAPDHRGGRRMAGLSGMGAHRKAPPHGGRVGDFSNRSEAP